MFRRGLLPLLALLFVVTPQPAQPPGGKAGADRPKDERKELSKGEKKAPTSRELLQWLEEPLDVKGYQSGLTLKQVLAKFSEAFASKGKELPLLVDEANFREENPDAPNVYDSELKFPPFPRRMPFRDALTLALSKVPTKNATFLVRRGCIEITTQDRAAPHRLLQERIIASFTKRPLAEVLDELSDMTGATLVLDPRLGEEGRTPVTIAFRNSVSLEAAVRLLAAMTGLDARLGEDDIFFITSHATKEKRERKGDLHLRDRPCHLALRDLARWSGSNVILDPYSATEPSEQRFLRGGTGLPAGIPRGDLPVSATFKTGTPPRVAATILAAMVGLEAVPIDEAVFVTTRTIAAHMQGNSKERPAKGSASK